MAKAAFSWGKNLFTSKLDFNLTKISLTLNPLTWKIWWAPNNASRWQMGFNSAFKGLKCYICSIALFCAENWTLKKVDQKYLTVSKCGAGEG